MRREPDHVEPGRLVALTGPGASTELAALAGADSPRKLRRRARDGVAYVPEEHELFATLTVAEHLRLGRRRRAGIPDEQLLAWFPELRGLQRRVAEVLSGGEQHLLALARALAGSPRLVLVDAFGRGLAPDTARRALEVLGHVAHDGGVAVVVAGATQQLLVASAADSVHVATGGVGP